jgi:hypothetical protein
MGAGSSGVKMLILVEQVSLARYDNAMENVLASLAIIHEHYGRAGYTKKDLYWQRVLHTRAGGVAAVGKCYLRPTGLGCAEDLTES